MCEHPWILKIKNIPVRFWIIGMIFLTSFMNSCLASNILFIINAMVVQSTKKRIPFCTRKKDGPEWMDVEVPDLGPRYDWPRHAKWHIQAAYFYGVAIASPPAGILAEWFGPKKTIFFPLLFGGIINVVSAIGAKWGWGVPLVCRFVLGLVSGTVYPALQCLIGIWAPPNEKGKFLNALMGDSLGIAVVWVMSQYTALHLGWPWTFYLLSMIICLYCTAFWFLTASNPEEHFYIKNEEIEYIRSCQGGSVSLEKEFPPFTQIINSSHCWALTILNFGNRWGVQLQMQMVPKFIAKYMGITARESVFLAILPHIATFCGGIVFGNVSDLIRSKKILSATRMSKMFVVVSHLCPAIIMMSLGSVKCNAIAALVLLILSNIFAGASVGATLRNPTDLSPNFAGTIFGLNMCLSQTTGFIVPFIGNSILDYQDDIVGWKIIFLIGGGAYFGTGIIYLCFGSAELQSWNRKIGTRLLRRFTLMPTY